VAAKLSDYSELECIVNNLDFKFDRVPFARDPNPNRIDVSPVSNPDGLRFVLPAVRSQDDRERLADSEDPSDSAATSLFITFHPTFSYHVKPVSNPITGVLIEGVTAPFNVNSATPSRNAEMLFGPGESPPLLDTLQLILFDSTNARLVTPIAVGQPLKAGDQMIFVNEAGTPSFSFTNRFPTN
jgi:hypothetical protein